MRRKQGTLLPIEQAILAAGIKLQASGTPEFHGFRIAKRYASTPAATAAATAARAGSPRTAPSTRPSTGSPRLAW